jgi:microcystin-dependent protein
MNQDDYLASVGATADMFAPRNTAFCQGQTLPLMQNVALFSLVGTTFGGDGYQNFQLPNLQGAVPFGTGSAASGASYEPGTEALTLTTTTWPQGWPGQAASGQAATVPTSTGPTGVALNWAIALYGWWPPREND